MTDVSEELSILKETAERLLADAYPFDAHRKRASEAMPNCLPNFRMLGEMGLLGATISEANSGSGMSAAAGSIIGAALATHLAPDPYVESVIVAAWLVEHGLQRDKSNALLGPLVSGDKCLGFANSEEFEPAAIEQIETTAISEGDGWRITGEKTGIKGGHQCSHLLVSARVEHAPDGLGLFLVDTSSRGLECLPYRTFDGAANADFIFSGAISTLQLFEGQAVWPWLTRGRNRADAVLAAQAASLMRRLLTDTIEYLKTRKQFGTEIGRFQALQHRASDMFVAVEEATAMATLALEAMDENRDETDPVFAAARVCIGEAARKVAHDAIQLHGGMGVTDELYISHGAKRLKAIAHAFGDETFQERRHVDAVLQRMGGA